MSEMILRAEKAIRANRHHTTEVQAREAIRSLREPTPEMMMGVEIDETVARHVWQHLIDEALKP